jgi:D-serine deaminase-like pyridoxal phosphate-dependent protein
MPLHFPLVADAKLDTAQPSPRFKSVAGEGDAPLKVGTAVLSSEDVFSPVMVMKQSALENNLRQLAAFCQEKGVMLAAHGKTSMAPAVLRRAVTQGGAWGISAATPAQVRALRHFGIRNVFLANECVDPGGIRWIGEWQRRHPDHGFLCYVDSLAGVTLLEQNLGDTAIAVLIEVSIPGGRTGCRTEEEVLAIAERIAQSRHLHLVGVAGYEGALGAGRDAAGVALIQHYCNVMLDCARMLAERQLFHSKTILLSAGGGAWFDVVTACFTQAILPLPVQPLIRSGAYMAHDSGLYSRIAPFSQPGANPIISKRPWKSGGACSPALNLVWRCWILADGTCLSIRICLCLCGFASRMAPRHEPARICTSVRLTISTPIYACLTMNR